jgi:putative ABC transport system permease protein
MILPDLLYAWRTIRKRPGFALLVSGTLALGIGANTAMFSVVNAVLIRPLPYPEPDQLVFMYGSFAKNPRAAMSPPDYLDYRAQNTVLSSFAARGIGGEAVLTGDGPPERVAASNITANFFETLGVAPLHGRLFRPDEEQGAGHDVAILSHGLWQRRFGGDPAIVGKTVTIDARATEIVGILPRRLDHSLDFELWQPLEFGTPSTSIRRFHNLRGVGRLAPGVTLAQAQANFDGIAARLAAAYPENETWSLRLLPYRDVVVGDLGQALVILLAAVGLVLLIACGNVANLQLARATARHGEILLRSALGASRMRLIRQLMTESLLLATIGGALGLVLAAGLVRVIRLAATSVLPRMAEVEIDPTVLGFTVVVSLATGLVFGLAPALHTVRRNVTATLVSLGRGSGKSGGRDLLVAMQVAVSTILLVGSGLLTKSLVELGRVETGFDPTSVLTANVALPEARYPDRAARERFWLEATERLGAIPGVAVASATSSLPLLGGSDTNYWLEGQPPTSEAERRNAMVVSVSDDYFRALGIPVDEGRTFAASERAGGPPALIVSRGLAARLFPGERAIGRRLVVDFGRPFTADIIGVVGDVRAFGAAGPTPDIIYFSAYQPAGFGISWVNLVIRATGDPASIAQSVRNTVTAIDRDLALEDLQTMSAVVGSSTAHQRFSTRLLAAFSVIAVVLAVIGLYGVLAFAVSQRSIEIGIRLALGAEKAAVFGMVVRRGLGVVGAGIGLGLVGAMLTSRFLQAQLYQVEPTDPLVYGFVAALLAVVGLAASVIPARRATRVDPVVALRGQQ